MKDYSITKTIYSSCSKDFSNKLKLLGWTSLAQSDVNFLLWYVVSNLIKPNRRSFTFFQEQLITGWLTEDKERTEKIFFS